MNFKRREVYREGKLQELTNREFCLLEYMLQHPAQLLTRDRLLNDIWGYDAFPTTRTVVSPDEITGNIQKASLGPKEPPVSVTCSN